MSDKKLFKLASKGDVRGMKKALKKGGNINAKDDKGYTLLHHAAVNDRGAMITYLGTPCEEHKGIDVTAVDDAGVTALLLAVFEKKEGAVYELLSIGCDPNFTSRDGHSVWSKANSLLPGSVVARMKAKAADARAKGVRARVEGRGPKVFAYDGAVDAPSATPAGGGGSEPPKPASGMPKGGLGAGGAGAGAGAGAGDPPLAAKSSIVPELSGISPDSDPLDRIGDTGAAINLDEITESVSSLVLAVSGKSFGEEGVALLNGAVKPLFVALKNMETRVPRFVTNMPDIDQEVVRSAAQRVSNSIKGLAPAVRELNATPSSAAAFKALKEIIKRLVISTYRFYTCCVGGQSPEEVARAIQDNAHSTKMLLRVAYARTSEEALEKAYRMVSTNTIEMLKVINAWASSLSDQSQRLEVFEICNVVARATEGLIISAKTLYAVPTDGAARKNVTTLVKALASKYQQLTSLTNTRSPAVTIRFDQAVHFAAAHKQLGAAVSRYVSKAPAATLLQREKQVILLLRNIVAQVDMINQNHTSMGIADTHELMESSRSISGDASLIAAIALNTARAADGVVGQQLLSCLQNALYFSMQTKLAACAKAIQVNISNSRTSLALSLRGLSWAISLMVESKLF